MSRLENKLKRIKIGSVWFDRFKLA